MAEQADLSLTRSQAPDDRFSREVADTHFCSFNWILFLIWFVLAFWLPKICILKGNINQFFTIYTVLVVLKCHGTGIQILHGHVNLMLWFGVAS